MDFAIYLRGGLASPRQIDTILCRRIDVKPVQMGVIAVQIDVMPVQIGVIASD